MFIVEWFFCPDGIIPNSGLTGPNNTYIHIYIYIYIYIYVLFGPVKPDLGVIPSGQENYSKAEHLNFPGKELNVTDITEQYFL